MKALINKLRAWLCSYICRPDEHEDEHESTNDCGIVTIDRGDEDG